MRLGQELDLLDAPGVLPPQLDDQRAALLLAICDDIGQAAYDPELVALEFLQLLRDLRSSPAAGIPANLLHRRYGIPEDDPQDQQGKELSLWLAEASALHASGDGVRMAIKVLEDFRRLALGPIALELPKPAAPPPAVEGEGG